MKRPGGAGCKALILSTFAARLALVSRSRATGENAGVSCVTPLTADLRDPRRRTRQSPAPIQEPLRAVLDPSIVIKKHRSSLPRNTVNFT
jgi:hypothetical protein